MSALLEMIDIKRAFIFDLFHTLTGLESTWAKVPMTSDFLGISREKWDEQLLDKSKERLIGIMRDPFIIIEKMAHAVDSSIPNSKIEEAVKNRIFRFESSLTNIPIEVYRTILKLKNAGKKIGLLSNADVMEKAGWKKSSIAPLFDSTIFSCDVGYMKPEKEIYEISLKELGVSASEAIFVGDGGSNELEGAKKVGIATIMIAGIIRELWPGKIENRLKWADYCIEFIPELVR